MRQRMLAPLLAGALALALGAGCAGGGSAAEGETPTPPPGAGVDVQPRSPELLPRGRVPFTATVTGAGPYTAVRWTVQEADGGSVDASGLYVAPATTGTYHVLATTVATPTMQGAATVTVTLSPTVAVRIDQRAPTVYAGAAMAFTATVTGAANSAATWSASGGSIDPSTGVFVAPASAGDHRITATSVADPSKSDSVTVRVGARSAGDGRTLVGIGMPEAQLDYSEAKLYADVQRSARGFKALTGGDAPVDANGWPTVSDFTWSLWDNASMNGTYTVYFDGSVSSVSAFCGATSPVTIHSGDTRTFTFRNTNAARATCSLTFRGAARPGGGPGVTNVKVMRPVTPGATASYPPAILFHQPIKDLVANVSTVRWMDFLATNSSQIATWGDRTRPNEASQRGRPAPSPPWGYQGRGGSLEHVVLFSNETGKDAWINVPHMADDDYVTRVAQLFAFGSDGVDPYTGPYGSAYDPVANPRPAANDPSTWTPGTTSWFPPLAPDLFLYVEYSNEIWNYAPAFTQTQWNANASHQECLAGGSSITYDGTSCNLGGNDEAAIAQRRATRRSVEVSKIFRRVFGDAQMPMTGSARVRPVLMTHKGGPEQLGRRLKYLWGYWNNGEGSFVADPHPPAYYFYGAGGSTYYGPGSAAADVAYTTGQMSAEAFRTSLLPESYRTAGMGLRRIAYEGNLEITSSSNAWMVDDPRTRTSLVDHHRVWDEVGGTLLVYFHAAGTYEWGFVQDINAQGTQRMLALRDIVSSARAAPLVGAAVPGSLPGAAHSGTSVATDGPRPTATGSLGLSASGTKWAAYTFRALASAPASVVVTLSSASGLVQAYLDGVSLGTTAAANGEVTFAAGTVEPGLHGVVVRAASGSFSVGQVALR